MELLKIIVQFSIIIFLIYFVSGRLIGPNVNMFKRILSVGISVVLTTFVFWYTFANGKSINEMLSLDTLNVSVLLWIGSMLLISMLLYLFFELFDPIEINENGYPRNGSSSVWKKYTNYWRQQKRLRQVLSVAVKNGVTQGMKYARNRESEKELAVALRRTLEECGGIFIKFGQVLSTRKEVLPPVFIEQLELLQQHVAPLKDEQVDQILQQNFGTKDPDIFSYFDRTPIASASIGQVHQAIIRRTNERVVVKLLRPEIKEIMMQDLSILVEFATWISSKSQWAEKLGFRDLAVGFAHSLQEEIDFEMEARNMIQVQTVLKKSLQHVKVPKVYREYSTSSVLVMEYIDGHSVAKASMVFEGLQNERKTFAEMLLFSFLEQALVSGIFHADPHPGNIYIEDKTHQITLLDFGAVGRLGALQQEGLKLFLVGIHQNNATVVTDGVNLLVENAEDIDREELEHQINDILLRISYIDHIEASELIYAIFTVVSDHGLKFFPAVSVALRALVTLDGTLKIIDPDFDIFLEAKQFSSDYIKSTLKQPFKDATKTKDRIEEEIALLIPNLQRIPRRLDQLFKKVESGKIILHHDIFSDKKNASFVTQLFSRFVLLMVGITFGIISVALLAISQFMESIYAIYLNTAAYLGLFLCAILLVRLSIQAIREMKKN